MAAGKTKELEKRLRALGDEGEEGKEKVDILNDLAFAVHRSDPERAEKYGLEALALAEKMDHKPGIASSKRTIGTSYLMRGSFDQALDCFMRSLEIFEGLGDKKGIASASLNVGNVYQNLTQHDQALRYYNSVMKMYKEIGDKQGYATVVNNIGISYMAQGDLDQALKYYKKALKIYEELDLKQGIAYSYGNIATIHLNRGNFSKALENYLEAEKIFKELKDKRSLAISWNYIGSLYTKLKNYNRALRSLERALKISGEIGAKDMEMVSYLFMSEMYETKEEYNLALEFYKKHSELKAKVFNEQSTEKINNLRLQYETEQKRREAEIYRLKNVELEKLVSERTATLEKELLERKRAEQVQSVLFNISQAVSKSDTLRELLGAVHEQLGKLLDANNFYVALYDEVTDTYTFPYEVDEKDVAEDYTPQQLKKSLTDYVRRQAEPLLVDDETHELLTREGVVETVGNLSKIWMGVPLKTGKRVIGVVVVQTYKDDVRYTFEDLNVLNFVAEGIALGIGRKKAEEEAREKLALIEKQQASILELSTPTIKIWEGVLVIPLIGVLDSKRTEHLTEELLTSITRTESRIAIIDITGVPTVDSAVANHLLKTVESVKLLGAQCVITGIRPDVAQTIIHLGIDITQLRTSATLSEGLKWALKQPG